MAVALNIADFAHDHDDEEEEEALRVTCIFIYFLYKAAVVESYVLQFTPYR